MFDPYCYSTLISQRGLNCVYKFIKRKDSHNSLITQTILFYIGICITRYVVFLLDYRLLLKFY